MRATIRDIDAVFELDELSNSVRAMPKITHEHMRPGPFNKMNCKLAIQLLSHSVSAAVKTAVNTGQLKSESGIATAGFIAMVDKTFNALNSKSLYDCHPGKRALSKTNSDIMKYLKEVVIEFGKLKKQLGERLTTPPCFKGLIQTINGILMLFEWESQLDPHCFIYTNRLQQDCLENFFSVIRQKNGYNPNPTVSSFRSAYASCSRYFVFLYLSQQYL